MKNTILVTGSNGIIGNQLINQILKKYTKSDIIVINRKKSNLGFNKRIISIELNLLNTSFKEFDSFFLKFKPFLLFHLAWNTNHDDYLTNKENKLWEKVSIMLIDSFYKHGGKRFVGIGSSIEYDWRSVSPFNEQNTPLDKTKFLYSKSKLNIFQYLKLLDNKSFLWCRIFFVFGPNQGESRLIPKLILNSLFGKNSISLNPLSRLDYISTFEIAKQIIMMEKSKYCGAVNICSGRGFELRKLVNLISTFTNKKIKVKEKLYEDKLESDLIIGDRSLINKLFPDYCYSSDNFKKDIVKTINHFKNKKS